MFSTSVWLCIFSLLKTLLNIQATHPVLFRGNIPRSNYIYYANCAPALSCDPNAAYRTSNGSCNNLNNPLWGSSATPYLRLAEGVYSDGDHALRKQVDGTNLPGPREVQLALFLYRTRDQPDVNNYHINQLSQWITHDMTLLPPDFSGPLDCCSVQMTESIPVQCKSVIDIPPNDPVYGRTGKKCMNFLRTTTASLNFNCPITPQIPMNMASSFIDASQVYGHTSEKAASLRAHVGGRLVSDQFGQQEFCHQVQRNGSSLCGERDNVGVCFDAGDPRANQHWGITIYHTIFVRFHNYLTQVFQALNPQWTDETLYQEVRKFIGAASQIMFYRDCLPVLLGEQFTQLAGLSISKFQRTKYDSNLIPQLTIEFSGSAFRVPHNILPSKYNFIGNNHQFKNSANLNEWMSLSDPLIRSSNFDDLLRGMTYTSGRAPTPSYNFLISNFMHQNFITGVQDLLSVDIQRGRDTGVPTYNTMKELCGFKRATIFEDFGEFIPLPDVMKLKQLYATVDDVDLLVGALLEPPCDGGMVGPTAKCILADVFYRVRFGDRFFFDVEGQPGSFSQRQLDVLWEIDLGYIFCATSAVTELPSDVFKISQTGSTRMENCQSRMFNLDFNAWKANS